MRPLASLLLSLLLALVASTSGERPPVGNRLAVEQERAAVFSEATPPIRVAAARLAHGATSPSVIGSAHLESATRTFAAARAETRIVSARVAPIRCRALAFPYDATAPPITLA